MTDTLLGLVPFYGAYLVGLATFLSCLALPIPSSLIMLTAGAFAATGDLTIVSVAGLALGGAVLGDQAGYAMGARGGAVLQRLGRNRRGAAELMDKARNLSEGAGGGPWIFLSRWLFSPLGPYMNFAAGAAAMDWRRFTIWGIGGEIVWVAIYLSLGYGFATNIEALADILGNLSGTLAAGALTVGLGLWLRAALRADRHRG